MSLVYVSPMAGPRQSGTTAHDLKCLMWFLQPYGSKFGIDSILIFISSVSLLL